MCECQRSLREALGMLVTAATSRPGVTPRLPIHLGTGLTPARLHLTASTQPLLSSSGMPIHLLARAPAGHESTSTANATLAPAGHQHLAATLPRAANPLEASGQEPVSKGLVWAKPAGTQPGTPSDTAGSKHVLLPGDKRSIFGDKSTSALGDQLRVGQPLPEGASLRSGEHRE